MLPASNMCSPRMALSYYVLTKNSLVLNVPWFRDGGTPFQVLNTRLIIKSGKGVTKDK